MILDLSVETFATKYIKLKHFSKYYRLYHLFSPSKSPTLSKWLAMLESMSPCRPKLTGILRSVWQLFSKINDCLSVAWAERQPVGTCHTCRWWGQQACSSSPVAVRLQGSRAACTLVLLQHPKATWAEYSQWPLAALSSVVGALSFNSWANGAWAGHVHGL